MIKHLTGAMAKRYFCKACKNVVQELVSTSVTRRVAIAWRGRLTLSKIFQSRVTNATDIFDIGRVSIITNKYAKNSV